jgi:hypothetical protein
MWIGSVFSALPLNNLGLGRHQFIIVALTRDRRGRYLQLR